jgi:septum formation inhibitor-activating ATPase MinD
MLATLEQKLIKKKVYTVLNNIEKEIVIDEELIIDKIDYLIELLKGSKLKDGEKVKQAAQLQEL